MRIDPDKIPIKYILGTEKENEMYPNSTDVMWTLVNGFIKEGKDNPVFTVNSLIKYQMPDADPDRTRAAVAHLIETGMVEPTKQPGAKEAFKIVQNPFV